MKTTGIFNYIKFEIPFKKYGEPLYLIPFGDVHRSAPLCHVEKWHEWINEVKDQKNTWFIGMGDYDDLSSTSERMLLNNRTLHDSTKQTLDDMYRKHTETLCNELSFMKDRLIGLLEGNHYSELTSGITTTQLMCEKLGCEYLGVSAFVMLLLKKDIHHAHRLDIWAHHGQSSGRTSGSSINKVEQMIDAADADIYLQGHDHKKHIAMRSRLGLSDSKRGITLDNKKIILARTGSFLKGYEKNKASYVADAGYSPSDLGTISIRITPQREMINNRRKARDDKRWLDLQASL